MKTMKYVVYREDEFFVSQCLNVDVSSFGNTIDEAIANLKDAVSLYLSGDDEAKQTYHTVDDAMIGESSINA